MAPRQAPAETRFYLLKEKLMASINMRPPSKGGAGKAASGANPASQKRVSNAPSKGSSKGMSGASGGKVKMSTAIGHGMSWKNSKG